VTHWMSNRAVYRLPRINISHYGYFPTTPADDPATIEFESVMGHSLTLEYETVELRDADLEELDILTGAKKK
jgi:hypothetical protein